MSEPSAPETLEKALSIIEQQKKELADHKAHISRLERVIHSWEKKRRIPKAFSLNFFKNLNRRVKCRISQVDLRQIAENNLFDALYYREQLLDRHDVRQALKAPLRHYLERGGFEGLDPSSAFDSDWYLATNSDVKAAGINPLVHYVLHGRHEGRMPYLGAKTSLFQGEPVSSLGFNYKLWNGFPHIALAELEQRADQGCDPSSAWYLAAWCYAHGDLDVAVERVEQSIANAPSGANQRALIGLAKCFVLLENYEGVAKVLADPANARLVGSAYPYIHANLLNGQGQWQECLAAFNVVFYRVGMMGVSLRDTAIRPALGNLVGELSGTGLSINGNTVEDQLPLVSVVVPAFNAGSTLTVALDGLLAQTWSELEIIVVDDGSTDDTAEVVRRYAERDGRIRYLPNSYNMGAYPTRNNGMRAAKGEFVTVHDSDDWSHPQKLERQLQPLLNDPSKVATFSSWVRVTADMRFVGPWLLSEAFVEKNHSSAVMRHSVLDEVGYWDEVNVAGDTEFLWRLEHNYGHQNIVHVLPSTPLSFALADDTSLTRTKATHVKTIHYGLRRIYRESAGWWHRGCEGRPVLEEMSQVQGGKRPFPIPLGIARGAKLEFDSVLVADFAVEGAELDSVLNAIDQKVAQEGQFCLFHWPKYKGWHGASIADEVFELCHRHNLSFAHMGLTIKAREVVMVDADLWEFPPSHAVQIVGVEHVSTPDGSKVEPQAEVLDYFLQGGVQSMAG